VVRAVRIYGKVIYNVAKRAWEIDCEPQVRQRLKRVFPRIKAGAVDLCLEDNIDAGRDLAWFLDRYPMEISPADMRLLRERETEHRVLVEDIGRIMQSDYVPTDITLAIPLRNYQAQAVDLTKRVFGLLDADDLGVGKTAIGIGLLADPRARPALVVTLTHLPGQWKREIERFAPGLNVHILKKGTPYKFEIRGGQEYFPDVIVTNYHKLVGWAEELHGKVQTVIFDEAHELRRSTSEKYSAAKRVAAKSRYRLGLTATPIFNFGGEFFNIADVLRPGDLGTWEEFCTEWCSGFADKTKATITKPKEFGAYVREAGLMIRRTRKEVGRELPPLTICPQLVDADLFYLDEIETEATALAKIVLSGGANPFEQLRASQELSWKLRQATGVAKAPAVAEFTRMLVEGEESVVLFGWHREVYRIWAERLADLEPVFFTGEETPGQKEAAAQAFIGKKTKLLIMSLRAGAGIDGLQKACRTAVYGEMDWSPAVHEQCLSSDTEILTPAGFLGVDAVKEGDEVAAFDAATGEIRWVAATSKVDRTLGDDERMYRCYSKKVDFLVTGDHRMVVRRKTRTTAGVGRSQWEFDIARNIAGSARRFIPTSGVQSSDGVPLSDYELRLLGWFVTDGHFSGHQLIFYQAEQQPWNEDLVEVLNGCGIGWTLFKRRVVRPSGVTVMNWYHVPKGNCPRWSEEELDQLLAVTGLPERLALAKKMGRTEYALYKKQRKWAQGERPVPVKKRAGRGYETLEKYLDKNLSPHLDSMTREQLRAFLRGVNMGDGAKAMKLSYKITSTNRLFFDRLQSLCVRRGFSANLSTRNAVTKAGKPIYDLWIADKAEASVARSGKPGGFAECATESKVRVWCLSNELGTLVTRRNGKVAIVGNCTGRLLRDGQPDPVFAYYLLADCGSDPVISDVLGVKRAQLEGIRDPSGNLIEMAQTDPERVKRLAEAYLRQRKTAPERQ